jgi:hypothetical protein
MEEPAELRRWIQRAFDAAAKQPPKPKKPKKAPAGKSPAAAPKKAGARRK